MNPTEYDHQRALIQWTRQHPLLNCLFSIPNGGFKLDIRSASKLKATGLKKGVPDLFLPIACKGFHGLFIEMKREQKAVVSPEQKQFHEVLRGNGYRVAVCRGVDSAITEICDYLGMARLG